jgi:hypothetical protein
VVQRITIDVPVSGSGDGVEWVAGEVLGGGGVVVAVLEVDESGFGVGVLAEIGPYGTSSTLGGRALDLKRAPLAPKRTKFSLASLRLTEFAPPEKSCSRD